MCERGLVYIYIMYFMYLIIERLFRRGFESKYFREFCIFI